MLSILELAPVASGARSAEALRASLDVARLADRLGFTRIWFAEHHNTPSIASTSPEVLIAHALSATRRVRVGAGGVMLPNHAPLRVAETYKMLEALHPGRVDLGIGRAPGTDAMTALALRELSSEAGFPDMLADLRAFGSGDMSPMHRFKKVRAFPTDVPLPPIFLLGSGDFSAAAAASLGLGFAFAAHFSPMPPEIAMSIYRDRFRPGDLPKPHAILTLSVICADTDEEARRLASSQALMFVRLRTARASTVPTVEEATAYRFNEAEEEALRVFRAHHVVGTPAAVRERIEELVARTRADEVMVSTIMHSAEERLRSLERLARVFDLKVDAGA